MMVVNGLKLPVAFVRLCRAITEGKLPDRWDLKVGLDAYGHPWRADLEILPDLEWINWYTDTLSSAFHQEGRFRQFQKDEQEPGFVPDFTKEPGFVHDFTDVSKLVWFGKTPSGEAFCFDFRADSKEPSVIYWDDGYWRRVAPGFPVFISLFKPSELSIRIANIGRGEHQVLPGLESEGEEEA